MSVCGLLWNKIYIGKHNAMHSKQMSCAIAFREVGLNDFHILE